MNPYPLPPIPIETSRSAQSIFGRSNFYLAVGDQANQLFEGVRMEAGPNQRMNPPQMLARLYLLTIFQYLEVLPDPLAADAVRERIEWKYALHLPRDYPGLQASLLCDFRRWLRVESRGQTAVQTLLQRLSRLEGFTCNCENTLGGSEVVQVVCEISRLALLWGTFKEALEELAVRQPAWLLAASRPYWYERYGSHNRYLNLRRGPAENLVRARTIGADGLYLMKAVDESADLRLGELDAVQRLRRTWRSQFETLESELVWRREGCGDCPVLAGENLAGNLGTRSERETKQ